MKAIMIALAAGGLLLGSPASAQHGDVPSESEAEVMAGLAAMFAVEPLSEEEQARLPAARKLIEKVVPTGALGEVMQAMMGETFGPVMQMVGGDPMTAVSAQLGADPFERDPDAEEVAEAAAILDPAWRERREREAEAMPQMMAMIMTQIEPAMREAMAELYAIYFTAPQLADIGEFFATPTGALYAESSLRMSSDPRITGAMMQAMPDMMAGFADMDAKMKALVADLPQPRTFEQLSAKERARLATLVGADVEELAERMAFQAEMKAEMTGELPD